MDNKIKQAAKNALEAVESLRHQLSDTLDDAPDDLKDMRQTMEKSLVNIHEKLRVSMEQGENIAGDAQLQAHWALWKHGRN